MRLSAVAAALCAAAAGAVTVNETTVTFDTRACQPPFDALPFCDTSLTIDERVADLVNRVWAEPANIPPQLTARHETKGQDGPNSNISALGIPEYDWGMNAIHGVQSSCVAGRDGNVYCPTSFPNPVNFGSAWNSSLAWEMGAFIGQESRALWLAGATEYNGSPPPHIGLDAWSPNINIARDPRWGRNQEVASEDPMINGDFGAQYSSGIQGTGPYKTVIVTLKHWDAYSLENSDNFTRYNFDANVSQAALASTYFPAFKQSVVQGGALGVMCSYNAVNGVPTCASSFLTSVLRGQWNFSGYITSDSGAINAIFSQHKYVATPVEAACVAIRDGTCDVNSGVVYQTALMNITAPGVCDGGEAAINASLARTFKLRMQLGLFDPPSQNPWWTYGLAGHVNTPEAQASSLSASRQSMVLLKNDGAALPLPTGKKVAIIGPHAFANGALLGNYLGQLCPFESRVGDFHCKGNLTSAFWTADPAGTYTGMTVPQNVTSTDQSGFPAAIALAKASDYVILAVGIDGTVEGEMMDRQGANALDLTGSQHALIQAIVATGVPTVMVLINGGVVDISPEVANPGVRAILSAGYPGAYGAQAIAQTILGQNDQLGGKTAVTWYYLNYSSQIVMSNMELDDPATPGRGYRYFAGPSLFPLGYGLAYTTFAFLPAASEGAWPSDAAAAGTLRTDARGALLTWSVNVTNTGAATGDEVVEAFFSPGDDARAAALSDPAMAGLPLLKQLFGYQRVHLAPGQSQLVTFSVSADTLKLIDRATGDGVLAPGGYTVTFTNGHSQTLRQAVRVAGPRIVSEPFPRA